jgi:hydroxyacyl-ACP dehydratase HTD2-like protein with hotdog domain
MNSHGQSKSMDLGAVKGQIRATRRSWTSRSMEYAKNLTANNNLEHHSWGMGL